MTNRELEERLTTIAAKAKDLRDAGVTRLVIEDVELELASTLPPPPLMQIADAQSEADPLDDPETFGGEVPRRRNADQPTPEDE